MQPSGKKPGITILPTLPSQMGSSALSGLCKLAPACMGYGRQGQFYSALVKFLDFHRSSVADLYCSMSGLALRESYTVWCSRNHLSDSSCTCTCHRYNLNTSYLPCCMFVVNYIIVIAVNSSFLSS